MSLEYSIFVLTLVFLTLGGVNAAVTADEVTKLPYLNGPLPSKQYSGYLTFDDPAKAGNTIHYHYWLSLAETDDATSAPLIYWSNGGPGCSSMEGTFFEGGAFNLKLGDNGTATVTVNPNRWSRFANVLYFETPVGVGFSYNSDNSYKDNNDTNTAQRNLAAMKTFFESYPEFQDTKLYLSGESYAGIYIPALAKEIIEDTTWNGGDLKGIAVGNGCTGAQTGSCAEDLKCNKVAAEVQQMLQYPYIPPTIRNNLNANNCTAQLEACLNSDGDFPTYATNTSVSSACVEIFVEIQDVYFRNTGPGAINPYGVELQCFYNMCNATYGQRYDASNEYSEYVTDRVGGSHLKGMSALSSWILKKEKIAEAEISPNLGRRLYFDEEPYSYNLITSDIPCIDSSAMSAYFNDPTVQEAIHVVNPGYCYSVCGQQPGFQYDRTQADNADTYLNVLIPRIHVLIYNGVEDLVVPSTDNYRWTTQIGLPVSTTNGTGEFSNPDYWKHWYYTEQTHFTQQLGGFYIKYNTSSIASSENSGFTYNMVLNAGHQVPLDAPRPALELYSWFVQEEIPLDNYAYPSDIINNTIYKNTTIYVTEPCPACEEKRLTDAELNGLVFGLTAGVLLVVYLTYLWTRSHVVHLMRQEMDESSSNVIGASFNTQTSNPLI